MLNSLRNFGRSRVGKILGVLLLIGLAGFGIENVITQLGSTTVASVAGRDISVRDYQRAYDEPDQPGRPATGSGAHPSSRPRPLGVPGMVLQRLAGEAVVNKLGQDLNLGVRSPARRSCCARTRPSRTRSRPVRRRQLYTRACRTAATPKRNSFDLQRKAAQRQQLIAGLLGDTQAPTAALELVNRYLGDTRTVDYFVLNAQALPPVADPTEEELAAFLTEHQAEFRTRKPAPSTCWRSRRIRWPPARSSRTTRSPPNTERTKDSRVKIERRQHPAAGADARAAGRLRGRQGRRHPIADLVTANNVTLQDLGTLARSEVTDSALAEAAFGLALNDYVIIPGIGSQRVVTVSRSSRVARSASRSRATRSAVSSR